MLQTQLIKYGLPLLLACMLAVAAYLLGYRAAYDRQQAVIEQIKKDNASAEAAAAQAYAAKLADVQKLAEKQQAAAQAVGIELAQANAKARQTAEQLKKGIDDALKQDSGRCADGLGTNSLREYRKALGYND